MTKIYEMSCLKLYICSLKGYDMSYDCLSGFNNMEYDYNEYNRKK